MESYPLDHQGSLSSFTFKEICDNTGPTQIIQGNLPISKASDRQLFFLFLKKFYLFIYLFLAALGLRCCARAFSSCGKWGLLFVAVHGLLIAVASLVAEHGL